MAHPAHPSQMRQADPGVHERLAHVHGFQDRRHILAIHCGQRACRARRSAGHAGVAARLARIDVGRARQLWRSPRRMERDAPRRADLPTAKTPDALTEERAGIRCGGKKVDALCPRWAVGTAPGSEQGDQGVSACGSILHAPMQCKCGATAERDHETPEATTLSPSPLTASAAPRRLLLGQMVHWRVQNRAQGALARSSRVSPVLPSGLRAGCRPASGCGHDARQAPAPRADRHPRKKRARRRR
jgi:hypothetical protein